MVMNPMVESVKNHLQQTRVDASIAYGMLPAEKRRPAER